jgi:uncharacterized protein (TIGR02453 family)
MTTIRKSTLQFLTQLSKNNDRDWFATHKQDYDLARQNTEGFVDALIGKMNEHDDLETPSAKKSLYRIYNDVRFSSDKTPYNPRFSGYLRRRKPFLRGGYYFWIKPGGSAIGCGFAHPNPEDLRRMRQDIEFNNDQWHKLISARKVKQIFGGMTGDQVKTAPRGYSADHPAIDLLRYKQYWFERRFKDSEVLDKKFLLEINNSFKAIRPFFNYMSDVLTTDANGVAL